MDDSIEFIMVLPGKTAKEVRQKFAMIIKRYFGGDQSMHAEIEANAASSHPIAQMARESLGMQAPGSPELVGFKRRREELELLKMEEEIKGMAQSRMRSDEEIKGMTQARILGLKSEMEQLSDPYTSKLDEPTRLMFKDTLQSLLMNENKSAPSKPTKRIELNTEASQEIMKRFLVSLVNTAFRATKITARELYMKFMDFHAATKGSADSMLTETSFCIAVKKFPGVSKSKGKTATVYTLDHAAIMQTCGGLAVMH